MSLLIATGVSHTNSPRGSRVLATNVLPAASPATEELSYGRVLTERRANRRRAGRHIAVLIVDGDAPSREQIAAAVTCSGIEAATAGSAAEALRLARGAGPVLVVSEMYLPDSTGIDLAHRLRELGARPAFIFVGGSLTISCAVEAMQLGALTVVEKPVDLQHLITLITTRVRPAVPVPPPADPSRFTSPHSVADRWATYVWRACRAPEGDFKTL